MRKPIISLKDVWKIYRAGTPLEVPALRGINVDIYEGDLMVLLGPSGSGKSTALNMLGALDKPTKGKVLLDGRDIAHLGESRLAKIRGRRIGFVFQAFNLIQTMTALENVILPMSFQNIPVAKRRNRAISLLRRVGLESRMNHLPSELSGGEQQRVSIARALANDPELIIADEPTGNLDTKTGLSIIKLLTDLRKEGKTVVIVTHDSKVAKVGKKIYRIVDGEIHKR